ncbi:hypothetical protein [Niveispirillum fermenti]|uniref:hypothetical protein n=1 Tax=Niveispirillum fermenti TaxID=1233113 RepID=UPI003A896E8D
MIIDDQPAINIGLYRFDMPRLFGQLDATVRMVDQARAAKMKSAEMAWQISGQVG